MSKILTIFFVGLLNTVQAQQIKTITEKYQRFLWSTVAEIDSFDTKGRLVKTTNCYGKRCKEQTIYKYIYNEKGQLTDNYIIDRMNGKDSIRYHHIYICHNENSLAWNKETTKECIQRYDFPTVWHWNKNGQLLRITNVDSFDINNVDSLFYNPFGTMNNLIIERSHIKGSLDYLCKIDYEYNDELLVKSTYKYYTDGKRSATSIESYEYDSLDRMIKRTIAYKDFQVLNYTSIYYFQWNEDQLISSTLERHENDKITKKETTFYKYDNHYNLIKTTKKQLIPESKRLFKTKLKYTFY